MYITTTEVRWIIGVGYIVFLCAMKLDFVYLLSYHVRWTVYNYVRALIMNGCTVE